MSTYTPSVSNLRRAIEITEQIEKLEAELRSVLSGSDAPVAAAAAKSVATPKVAAVKAGKKKRTMSPEARARIVAAQKARWAKFNAEKAKKGKK